MSMKMKLILDSFRLDLEDLLGALLYFLQRSS